MCLESPKARKGQEEVRQQVLLYAAADWRRSQHKSRVQKPTLPSLGSVPHYTYGHSS